ncbi:MAG: DUF429 domain-containing protein, partial [Hyphococcus sp.]
MPATSAGKEAGGFVLGVDGCRAGWAAVRLSLTSGETSAAVVPDFAGLLAGPGAQAAMIMVDMPIGLADAGRRACEQAARQVLKPHRHNSVFSAPRRPMLSFATYAEANAWGKAQGAAAGGGLSKQAWMITPKIREIDAAISPADQKRLGEGHPEVAFWRLNDRAPCRHPKRTPEGAAERLVLLRRHGLAQAAQHVETLKQAIGANIARDDVYDACALALTAKARLEDAAVRLGDG